MYTLRIRQVTIPFPLSWMRSISKRIAKHIFNKEPS